MAHAVLVVGVWVSAGMPAQAQHVVAEDPLTAEQQREQFRLPAGFEIQLVASEPDIAKPINLNFDHQGRLLVTQSVEYPYAAQEGGRDAVVRLTIDPAGGQATQVERLIEGLNIPIGVAAVGADVIVFSIPNIYRYSDSSGDGRLDHREVLYGPFGFDDTHGLNNAFTRGVDGWFYACHGFRNQSRPLAKDGQGIAMTSGNTYRFKDDGARIEHFTHGQVNPFGLCFDPRGDVYTADCHTKPGYLLLRGACYPSFGRPHDGLGFGPELMQHLHESTGIAGIVYYDAEQFPQEYRDTLLIGNPITGRLNHDRLERHGSTYKAVLQPDFLSCADKWFRPVDLQLGPDGAVYIADFYNRIIGHYEVPLDHPGRDRHRGRIWRIVYKPGEAEIELPAVSEFSQDRLIEALADANLTLRTQATHELVDRFGREAVAAVERLLDDPDSPPAARAHGLWALHRLEALSLPLAHRLLQDEAPLVRLQAMKALAQRPAWSDATRERIWHAVHDDDPFVRRAAAEALGRHPAADNLHWLLALWAGAERQDELLIHAARIALRDHLLLDEVLEKVDEFTSKSPPDRARLLEVSLGAPTAGVAQYVLRSLARGEVPAKEAAPYLGFAARHAEASDLPLAFQQAETYRDQPADVQLAVLRAVRRGLQQRGQAVPDEFQPWAVALGRQLLEADNFGQVREGIELARELKLAELFEPLAELAASGSQAVAELRPAAIDACIDNAPERAVPLVERLLADAAQPIKLRQRAAAALGRVNSAAARSALLAGLRLAPEAVAASIAAGLAGSREGADQLLSAVAEGKASAYLLKHRDIETRLRESQPPEIEGRLSALIADLPPAVDQHRQLIDQRREGFLRAAPDLAQGREVFVKTCAACHRLAGEGQKIGPELDGIGIRGLDRILEDVLDPSRIVDGAFRTTVLMTTDGRTVSGLLLRKEGEVLVLADAQGKEVRVPAAEVEEQRLSPLSPMPANVPQLVEEADFYHLIGFLLDQRQQEPAEDAN